MMPSGLLSFTGLAVQQPFARKLLDRLKIRPLVIQREVGWPAGRQAGRDQYLKQKCLYTSFNELCLLPGALAENME